METNEREEILLMTAATWHVLAGDVAEAQKKLRVPYPELADKLDDVLGVCMAMRDSMAAKGAPGGAPAGHSIN